MKRLLFVGAALYAAASPAQELPPVGTYTSGEINVGRDFKWPDPKSLAPQQRMALEALLRNEHEDRLRKMMAEQLGVSVKEARLHGYLTSAKLVSCSIDRNSRECETLTELWLDSTVKMRRAAAPSQTVPAAVAPAQR